MTLRTVVEKIHTGPPVFGPQTKGVARTLALLEQARDLAKRARWHAEHEAALLGSGTVPELLEQAADCIDDLVGEVV